MRSVISLHKPSFHLPNMSCSLREELASSEPPVNTHTLNRVPASPPTDQRQELPFSPPNRHDSPKGTAHPGSTSEGLIPKRCLDLADIR